MSEQVGQKGAEPAAQTASQMVEMPLEDLPVAEDGARICWKQFAAALPQEHSALAGRLSIMRPKLLDGLTIQVIIDNRMVAADFQQVRPQIEQYLRRKLQNSKLVIDVVVDETLEVRHIYSRVEQYQILEKRYSVLARLKEALDLDLS